MRTTYIAHDAHGKTKQKDVLALSNGIVDGAASREELLDYIEVSSISCLHDLTARASMHLSEMNAKETMQKDASQLSSSKADAAATQQKSFWRTLRYILAF